MSARDLAAFFAGHKNSADGLVLATVYETQGATYSKTGARMLIDGNGDFQGMLSGGCLEGDLAERARQVIATGEAQRVTYDLREDDDSLWGLGVGCEGLMRILLQPLVEQEDFQPFPALMSVLSGDRMGVALTVVESDDPDIRTGATLVGNESTLHNAGIADDALADLSALMRQMLNGNQPSMVPCQLGNRTLQVLCAVLKPPPNVLILGAGLDAQPIVRFCDDLGWRVTVQDHRPAYLEKGDFTAANDVHCLPAESLAAGWSLDAFDAAVVMSHHLVTDLCYLRQIASTSMVYIGLLGPHSRRARLMKELGEQAAAFEGRLHGPAGLDIGGRGPASIALSILAQMHEVLMRDRGER